MWLKERFGELRKAATEVERRKGIDEIVNWTNPGPGGFYDDLGNPGQQPHLVRGAGFERDPQFFESSLVIYERFQDGKPRGRKSWWDHAIAFYDQPLRMRYTGLDREAQYKLRTVYAGDSLRLVADDRIEVHPLINKKYEVAEFDIPAPATSDGELTLSWYRPPGGAARVAATKSPRFG